MEELNLRECNRRPWQHCKKWLYFTNGRNLTFRNQDVDEDESIKGIHVHQWFGFGRTATLAGISVFILNSAPSVEVLWSLVSLEQNGRRRWSCALFQFQLHQDPFDLPPFIFIGKEKRGKMRNNGFERANKTQQTSQSVSFRATLNLPCACPGESRSSFVLLSTATAEKLQQETFSAVSPFLSPHHHYHHHHDHHH